MSTAVDSLPLSETHSPADQAALAALVGDCYQRAAAIYPIGGGTSLGYGLPASVPGVGVTLGQLNRIVDYPARDMTITVEAGITLDALANTLAKERQWLPVEGAQPASATLGGLVATASSGPRRYGYGTMRDYVIGITAVDGRGNAFKAGGRVVKNVAGYDFCKLLTGSLGTLAVISQMTLKVRPLPESTALLSCSLRDFAAAERLLAALVNSTVTPSAVELLAGPAWRDHASLGVLTAGYCGRLVVGLEGSKQEVDWMLGRLTDEWHSLGINEAHVVAGDAATSLWRDLREFPSDGDAPLVIKASLPPSRTAEFAQLALEIDPQASILSHAGNGIVIVKFSQFDAADISRKWIGRLQPAAQLAGGSTAVLSSTLDGLTRQAVWGNAMPAHVWMTKVKRQFDPKNLLNPGRFVYDPS